MTYKQFYSLSSLLILIGIYTTKKLNRCALNAQIQWKNNLVTQVWCNFSLIANILCFVQIHCASRLNVTGNH